MRLTGMTNGARPSLDVEQRLVGFAQAGDTASFETLVRRHIDRMYAVARLMLRDTDLAEDAVQGALVRAWRDLRSLHDAARFEAWLHKLLVRSCYDEARRKRRWLAEVRALTPVPDVSDSTEGSLGQRDAIEQAFRAMSPDHRMVLVLHFYLDLPVVEIAKRLDVPAGTARSRLHYALAALRALLEAAERGDHSRSGSIA